MILAGLNCILMQHGGNTLGLRRKEIVGVSEVIQRGKMELFVHWCILKFVVRVLDDNLLKV